MAHLVCLAWHASTQKHVRQNGSISKRQNAETPTRETETLQNGRAAHLGTVHQVPHLVEERNVVLGNVMPYQYMFEEFKHTFVSAH